MRVGGRGLLKLAETIKNIGQLDQGAMEQTQKRLDSLAKPPSSLGRLEEICLKLAGIYEEAQPKFKNSQLVIFAADHGVVEEGVSAFPQAVTEAMIHNFLKGGAAVNVFSRQAGTSIRLVDLGIKGNIELVGLKQRKVKASTDNFCLGPAMSKEEALAALHVGLEMALEAKEEGISLLATGEMGIGNTTASSALAAVLANLAVEEVVGRGTGVDDQGLQIKIAAIKKALAVNKPDPHNPLDVLAKVGGLEIAGLAGLFIGAASLRIPIIIDGFISSAAALVAAKMAPAALNFMLASHASREPGHSHVLKELGLEPAIYLDMRLGEGTGAILMVHIIKAALLMLNEMACYDDLGV